MPRKIWVEPRDMGHVRERKEDHVVIGLRGPYGGKRDNIAIGLDEARRVRDALTDAIAKLEYQAAAEFNEQVQDHGRDWLKVDKG